jgi:hypothetical protein
MYQWLILVNHWLILALAMVYTVWFLAYLDAKGRKKEFEWTDQIKVAIGATIGIALYGWALCIALYNISLMVL